MISAVPPAGVSLLSLSTGYGRIALGLFALVLLSLILAALARRRLSRGNRAAPLPPLGLRAPLESPCRVEIYALPGPPRQSASWGDVTLSLNGAAIAAADRLSADTPLSAEVNTAENQIAALFLIRAQKQVFPFERSWNFTAPSGGAVRLTFDRSKAPGSKKVFRAETVYGSAKP